MNNLKPENKNDLDRNVGHGLGAPGVLAPHLTGTIMVYFHLFLL